MRITNKMLSNNFLTDMTRNLSNLKTLQQQLTSGKEIRKPSDDPFKVARAMQLHTDINTNKQFNSNITSTINWLDTTDTALGQGIDVLQRIRELLVNAGNGAYSGNERLAIKDEINEKIGEMGQILNTNFDGSYIFGGTRGTTKPVEVLGGTNFGNAASTGKIIIDNTDTSGKSIIDKDYKLVAPITIKITKQPVSGAGSPLPDITIAKDTKITSLSDLASIINKKMEGTDAESKLKAIPNYSEGKIMFVNTNAEEGSGVNYKIISITSTPSISIDRDTAEYKDNNLDNARLIYYKKDGGELVDGAEYNQIGTKLKVQIAQAVVMDYNVTATEVMEFKNDNGESKDLRDILNNIINHLDGKNDDGSIASPDSVKDLVNGDLKNMTDAINNFLKIRSEVGAKQNRMDSAKDKNLDSNFNMTEILSKTEDIDFTEKTMEFAVAQTVYMASLQASARVLQPSLLDYLR